MILHDVTIAGASAAGLFAADLLARKGLSVRLLERSLKLEPAPRTLIVTPRVRQSLGRLVDDALVNEVHRYELYADGQIAKVTLSEPDLVIERGTLIAKLAESCRSAGVDLAFGRRFVGVRPDASGLRVKIAGDEVGEHEVASHTLVGADGVNSAVAKAAGWPRLPTVPLIQAVVRLPDDLDPQTTRVWFRPQDTPYFYWLIPQGPDRAVLGLIGEQPRTARRKLEAFLREKGYTPHAYQAAKIPAYWGWVRPHRRVGVGDVFLVGDAAGHVKISTVGGIHTGFRGSQAVAEILTQGTHRELRALRRELDRHMFIRRALHRFAENDYRRMLTLLSGGTRKVLARHTRDDSSRLLWRLCLREPRLVLLGLRGLLSWGDQSEPSPSPEPAEVVQPTTLPAMRAIP